LSDNKTALFAFVFYMKAILRKIVALSLLICSALVAWGEEKISFKADAPMIVSMGEPFRINFELNTKPERDTFEGPSFEGFEILAGPQSSTSSSTQWVNGKTTSSYAYTITYVLMPQRKGTFTIGAASIEAKKRRYSTQPIAIEVREGRQESNPNESAESRATNSIQKDDLLLRFEVSKNSVYKGEPVRALLRLYTRVDNIQVEQSKLPAFNGFWSQQVDIEQGPFREVVNGKIYNAYNIAEYLLYPQKDGVITIEPAEMTILAQVVVQIHQSFFGGIPEAYNVRRELKTAPIKINVKPLPPAPASFTGAVGRYTLSHNLTATTVPANSAATLQLKISGTGNLKFINAPNVALPTSFDLYEVKSEEQIENRASGSVGYRRFDYPFIVRAEGTYDIEPIEFTFFDAEKGKYTTLTTPPLKIEVTPDGSATAAPQGIVVGPTREDVRLLGEDIRFIKPGKSNLRADIAPFVLSQSYWLTMLLLVVVAVVVYCIVRKYLRDRSNVVLVKGKRANKMAVKRFRIAEKYKREQDRRAFYEEMLRAMWGYLGDRFNIPVADLTREVVRQMLSTRGATAEAEAIIAVIARCEEAQYSPAATAAMEEIYEEGVDAVSKIESAIKK
jgi:hypothetical protein